MQAEESLARKNLDKEYADILGIPAFRQATAELMLTKSCPFVQKKQVGLDVCSSCLSVMLNESYVCMYVCMSLSLLCVPFSSSSHPPTPITVSAGCFCSDHLWHWGSQHSSKVYCECLPCPDRCTHLFVKTIYSWPQEGVLDGVIVMYLVYCAVSWLLSIACFMYVCIPM